MKDNLLIDPVIPVEKAGFRHELSLPGVLAALHNDEIDAFPALRPHHRHPWHAFLCQLTVLALEDAGKGLDSRLDETCWRDMLRSLTPGYPDDEPWRLVVPDLSSPAFLQSPVPKKSLSDFKIEQSKGGRLPRSLDVIVTSKQHGEKDGGRPSPIFSDWFYDLLVYQTFSGQMGRGNYGIARQNGGFAARHGVTLTISPRPGPNWRRDVRILLRNLGELRNQGPYPPTSGLKLLWLTPWGGDKAEALPLNELHPLFIEIARRIRLFSTEDGGIAYHKAGTQAARVHAKDFNGVLGDPWMPVNQEDHPPKSYNGKPHYSLASRVLFDKQKFSPALLQSIHADDPEIGLAVIFRVFLRTQGGSDGYHERIVPIGRTYRGFLRRHADVAANMAEAMVNQARKARFNVLKPALLQLMQAGREQPNMNQKETIAWANRYTELLDNRLDAAFFSHLWQCLDIRGTEALDATHLMPWNRYLTEETRRLFQDACSGLPTVGALRYRAVAKSENMLESLIKKHLKAKE